MKSFLLGLNTSANMNEDTVTYNADFKRIPKVEISIAIRMRHFT